MTRDTRDLTVKLVTDAGRTVCAFVKRMYLEDDDWAADEWGVAVKPASEKVRMHPDRPRPVDQNSPDRYLKEAPEGRRVLEVPGLTLRWERVVPVLDKLAAAGVAQVTVGGLRDAVNLSR